MEGALSIDKPSPDARLDAGRGRLLALAVVAAFALLATVETVNSLWAPRRVASDADWNDAAAEVRAGFRPGDLIVFAPAWSDPVGRLHLGDLVPPEMAARPDDDRYRRIWEVSTRGARSDDTRARDAWPVSSHQHGRVRVSLYEKRNPVTPLYDFTERLGDARVLQTPGGAAWETPCLHDKGGYACSTTRVEKRILEIDYRPRAGILVPVDGRLVTSIHYDDVPLGGAITGHVGLHDYYARKNADGPVHFKVLVNEQPLFEENVRNDDAWARFSVDTARFAGTRGKVRFEVSAPSAAWRNFGFHAESRSSSEAPIE